MRGEELLEKMELVDPAYVEAADTPRRKAPIWLRWGALAACAVLAVCAGLMRPQKQLPLLTVPESVGGGMGFEGYAAHDISELVSANPWREDWNLATLPVFQNPITYDEIYHLPSGVDLQGMEALLRDVAGRLGLDEDALIVTDNAPDAETRAQIEKKMELTGTAVPEGYFDPTAVKAEAAGVRIQVDLNKTVTVTFDPAVSLPETYRFTYDACYEELAEAAEYLKTQYRDLLSMDQPVTDISGGDYGTDGLQNYSLAFYEGASSKTQQFVAYHFNRVSFSPNDAGELSLCRVSQPDLSQKLGDYPIITVDEARERLSQGHYLTSVTSGMPGTQYVHKVELVYRTGEQEAYWMPYYRFYVELPEWEQDGLKTYGAYYVPAVKEEYLTNLPTWDGGFN